MIENWNDVHIVPEFSDQGVDCYRLAGGSFVNEYYIVSEAETRKLMSRCAHCSGGNGGDQAAVPVTAGQTVSLDFTNKTGEIK